MVPVSLSARCIFNISIRGQNIGKDSDEESDINTIIAPIVPSGFSLTSLVKKSASRLRLLRLTYCSMSIPMQRRSCSRFPPFMYSGPWGLGNG